MFDGVGSKAFNIVNFLSKFWSITDVGFVKNYNELIPVINLIHMFLINFKRQLMMQIKDKTIDR